MPAENEIYYGEIVRKGIAVFVVVDCPDCNGTHHFAWDEGRINPYFCAARCGWPERCGVWVAPRWNCEIGEAESGLEPAPF